MPQRLDKGKKRKIPKSFSIEESVYDCYQDIVGNRPMLDKFGKAVLDSNGKVKGRMVASEIRRLMLEDIQKEVNKGKRIDSDVKLILKELNLETKE